MFSLADRQARIQDACAILNNEQDLSARAWLQLCQDVDEVLLAGEQVSLPMSATLFIHQMERNLGQHPVLETLRTNPNYPAFAKENEGFEGYLVYVVAHLNDDSTITASGRTSMASQPFLEQLLQRAHDELPNHPATTILAQHLAK